MTKSKRKWLLAAIIAAAAVLGALLWYGLTYPRVRWGAASTVEICQSHRVRVQLKSVSRKELSFTVEGDRMPSTLCVSYLLQPGVECKVAGVWYRVEPVRPMATRVGWEPGEETYPLQEIYGNLPEGEYRLVLPLMLEDAAAQPEWERLWLALEFTLT